MEESEAGPSNIRRGTPVVLDLTEDNSDDDEMTLLGVSSNPQQAVPAIDYVEVSSDEEDAVVEVDRQGRRVEQPQLAHQPLILPGNHPPPPPQAPRHPRRPHPPTGAGGIRILEEQPPPGNYRALNSPPPRRAIHRPMQQGGNRPGGAILAVNVIQPNAAGGGPPHQNANRHNTPVHRNRGRRNVIWNYDYDEQFQVPGAWGLGNFDAGAADDRGGIGWNIHQMMDGFQDHAWNLGNWIAGGERFGFGGGGGAWGNPNLDLPPPAQPLYDVPEYDPKFLHGGKLPEPGFTHSFDHIPSPAGWKNIASNTESSSLSNKLSSVLSTAQSFIGMKRRRASPAVIDLSNDPSDEETEHDDDDDDGDNVLTIVCAGCDSPLMMGQEGAGRIWALRCGHLICGGCLERIGRPPKVPQRTLDLMDAGEEKDSKEGILSASILTSAKGKGKGKARETSFDRMSELPTSVPTTRARGFASTTPHSPRRLRSGARAGQAGPSASASTSAAGASRPRADSDDEYEDIDDGDDADYDYEEVDLRRMRTPPSNTRHNRARVNSNAAGPSTSASASSSRAQPHLPSHGHTRADARPRPQGQARRKGKGKKKASTLTSVQGFKKTTTYKKPRMFESWGYGCPVKGCGKKHERVLYGTNWTTAVWKAIEHKGEIAVFM